MPCFPAAALLDPTADIPALEKETTGPLEEIIRRPPSTEVR
jgi:hypothetical protein